MYTLTHHEAVISVPDYIEGYVDIPTFLEACRACPNYGQVWACPPYDFDVLQYWNRYKTLRLFASKITFQEELLNKSYTPEEISSVMDKVLPVEKQRLADGLFVLEKETPGSVSLSAGSCTLCQKGCQRPLKRPCLYPETMRYSLESLGGNVGLTLHRLMHIDLEWMEENRLPHHFVLVSGLLLP